MPAPGTTKSRKTTLRSIPSTTSHSGARTKKLKDPDGGLTAAGRAHFKKTEGANLKPGVKTVKGAEDMKRKGSFLRRHYGKKVISPLTDKSGEPTRYAKQAHAWGEPVPKTLSDVKRLAKKGTALLERYRKHQDAGAADAPKSSRKQRANA